LISFQPLDAKCSVGGLLFLTLNARWDVLHYAESHWEFETEIAFLQEVNQRMTQERALNPLPT
jgi:hypothetical protein